MSPEDSNNTLRIYGFYESFKTKECLQHSLSLNVQ